MARTQRQVFDCTRDQYINEILVGNKWVENIELDCTEQEIRSEILRIRKEYKVNVKEQMRIKHSQENTLKNGGDEMHLNTKIDRLYKEYEQKQLKLVSLGYEMEEKRECCICLNDYYVSLEYDFASYGYGFLCFQPNHTPCHTCFNQCKTCPMCREDKECWAGGEDIGSSAFCLLPL